MRRWLFCLFAIYLLAACGDDASSPPDAASPDASAPDAASADAASPDAGPSGPVSSCLDVSTDLPRPPTDRLPCDLLPPGL